MKNTLALRNTRTTLSPTARHILAQRAIRRRNVLTSARAYLFSAFLLGGCGYAGTPPNHNVTVSVQPPTANLALGQSQQFQATVTGSSNDAVSWNVNGIAGGNSTSGTVSASGLYTAPAALPNPTNVTVTAVSQADAQASGSATVTLSQSQTNIVVAVAPPTANVPTGGAQVFTATVSGTTSSGVTWSVNGIAGGNATFGTIIANNAGSAVYTAPSLLPSPASVTVTATSTADPTKSASATVTITCANPILISPPSANLALAQTQTFTASFCAANTATIVWDVNGIPGGNSANGSITVTSATTAAYTAPADLPVTNPSIIHATAGALVASATVTIVSSVMVSVAPPSASVATSQRVTLTPSVANTSDTTVTWTVNGIANGNAAAGQICQHASNPCQPPAAPSSASIDYLAPATAPAPNPVAVTAISHADPSKSASAAISVTSITGPVAVTISPNYAFVSPSSGAPSTQQFFASVTGSANRNVSWTVQSGVAGQGCAGAACGSISAGGLYTSPATVPSPNAVSVIATAQADPTKSATAAIAITSGVVIDQLLPSSVFSGAVESFPLAVHGLNFVAGSGSAASTILLNGTPRGTTCPTTSACATALNPSDVQSAATLTVQVQNPGPNGALSNQVPFVIIPFDSSVAAISLSSAQLSATSIIVTVPEPTTAAASAPINVDTIGLLTGGNNCGIQGSPLTITRPASGTSTVSLCIHGNGLDPTFTYSFSGAGGAPAGSDLPVTASAINGLFPNTIELDLQLSNTTLPGVRTLFITTLNNDRGTATGMLEVK
ncbi:MAG: hypothetical protein WAL95_08700 [Candidatus Acidiferrales bacterium]